MFTHIEDNRTLRHVLIATIATASLLAAADSAHAQQAPGEDEPADAEPVVIHHPTATVLTSHRVRIDTRIEADWKLDETLVAVRPMNTDQDFVTFGLERTGSDEFSTILPADLARPPGVEYYIVSHHKAGEQRTHFASAESPYQLLIRHTHEERTESRRLARFDGARSRFRMRGDYTSYGRRNVAEWERLGDDGSRDRVTDAGSDAYWATEVEYTYRMLTWLHDFRFGIGTLRGTQPTVTVDSDTGVLGSSPGGKAGYDYGFGEVNMAASQYFSMGFRLILGASDAGFAAGGGAMLRLGELSGTYFELGGELQQTIGNRGWMGFRWDTVPSVPMGLTIELSQRPTQEGPSGTRLLYDIGYDITSSVTLNGRIGYASRASGIEPGFVGGLGAGYEF